jgi:hypothetical protein
MQNRQLASGDILFSDFSFDVQSLANSFIHLIQAPRSQHKFTLNVDTARGRGWRTVFAEEFIEENTIGHFEFIYTEQCSGMIIGALEGAPTKFDYLAHVGYGGKSIYLRTMSLYATSNFIEEKDFLPITLANGDKIGLFFDMREKDNGRMFFTHNGRVIGQMFKDLKSPIYPAISYSPNLVKGDLVMTLTNDCPYPTGWSNMELRDEEYVARTRRMQARTRNVHVEW